MVMLRFGARLNGQTNGWVMQRKEVRKQGQMWEKVLDLVLVMLSL